MDRLVQARRWITAFLLIGIIVPLLIWGGKWSFMALIGLVVVLGQMEYERLSNTSQGLGRRVVGILVAISMPAAALLWGERGLLMAVVGSLLFWMVLEMASRVELNGVVHDLGLRSLGYLYGALLPCYFVLLWKLPAGIHWILLAMTITVVGDTAAYYVGSLWGRHPLQSRISPKKTVEGSLAGLLGNAVGALAFGEIVFPVQTVPKGMLLALLVGVAGQLGDLSESMLKRSAGVKDSSGILPGHGGVLDRLDSLFFAAPVVYYWVTM